MEFSSGPLQPRPFGQKAKLGMLGPRFPCRPDFNISTLEGDDAVLGIPPENTSDRLRLGGRFSRLSRDEKDAKKHWPAVGQPGPWARLSFCALLCADVFAAGLLEVCCWHSSFWYFF